MIKPLGARQNQSGPLPPFSARPEPPRPKEPVRSGRAAAVLLLVAFCLVLVGLAVIVPRQHRARQARLQAEAREQAARVVYDVSRYSVRQDEIMPFLLTRGGFSTRQTNRIVVALRRAGFNLHAMRPGDSLLVMSLDSVPVRLLYQRNPENVYRVDLDTADCRVSMLLRNIRMAPVFIKGVITTSLYDAMLALGEKPQLIADFTDVFGWEVDFFTEVQPKDSFSILFERKYCDSVYIGYGSILAATYSGQVGTFSGFRFAAPDGTADYYNGDGQNLRKTFQKSPLRFSRVSSFFGRRFHPVRRVVRQHSGIDYVAPKGTPVECVSDGRVVSAGWAGGYGRLVVVGHAEGYSTYYGHLSGFGKGIRQGQPVRQGQVVGYVGSTGLSTGPHLHYEIHKLGSAVNPMKLNPPRHSPVKQAYMADFGHLRDSLSVVVAAHGREQPPPRPRTR
jgi:murein DD-endopeptidase MepM/ murein hydrolase activator NlpD